MANEQRSSGGPANGRDSSESSRANTLNFPTYDAHQLESLGHSLAYLEGPPPPSPGTDNSRGANVMPFRYFEGISRNAQTLGISRSDLLDAAAKSPFTAPSFTDQDLREIPEDLRPTPIQRQIDHHPFFDCIPISSLRDKAILAGSTDPPLISRFDLCYDMFAGGLNYRDDAAVEQNWQYSDQFRLKWQALLNIDTHTLQRHVENSQRRTELR